MRNPTIWESAGRPLFVRTVWLESSALRRGLQRHFLWDYDTKRPTLERLNSVNNHLHGPKTDFNEFNLHKEEEEIFLIGSAKVKLHEPFKLMANKKSKSLKYRRKSSIFNQRYTSYDNYQLDASKEISRRPSDISDLHLQQLPGTAADELLADRVLNWLDLAGKEEFFQNLQQLKEMEVKLSKTCRLRQDAIKRYHQKTSNTSKTNATKTKNNIQRAATAAPAQSSSEGKVKSSDAIKQITIIFNKEGQAIRLNRPAQNIDLCSLSAGVAAAATTTRKLAGSLASPARLYKSAQIAKTACQLKSRNVKDINNFRSARRRLDTVADLTSSSLQKRLHDRPVAGVFNNLHDAKQQLHIFMPTLPKKGLNSSSIYDTEDGISELSHNFSEMCKI